MTLHGYRDWNRVVQHAADAVLDTAITTGAVSAFDFGTYFVGDASHCLVYALNGVRGMNLSLTWSTDGTPAHFTGIDSWEADIANSTIFDYVAVKGNYVQVQGNFAGGPAVQTPTVRIVPLIVTYGTPSAVAGTVAASLPFQVIGAGVTVQRRFGFVASGHAFCSFAFTGAVYAVRVSAVDRFGTQSDVGQWDNTSGMGIRWTQPFYVPRQQIILQVTNQDGVAQSVDCWVTMGRE